MQIGRLVIVNIGLVWGAGTAGGNGNWTFTLPIQPTTGVSFGSSTAFDSSTATYYPGTGKQVLIISTIYGEPIFVGGLVSNGIPFVWASGDALDFSLVYSVA